MLIKIVMWLLLSVAVLSLVLAVVLQVGAAMSLDRGLEHSAATSALPEFTPQAADGLVRISAGGQVFRARVAGVDAGSDRPAVILLHGFPVTSAMWLEMIEPMASAGYRVVAFDQRGYSPGARPAEIADYRVDKLTADVLAVADAVGFEKFHLVGHDWGAGVGWSVVINHPERVASWSALSIAHPAAFSAAVENDPDQRARSRYFAFFVMPWLPQTLFSFNGFAMLKTLYADMSPVAREEYLRVFAEPGALSAALNWYRAMVGSPANADNQSIDDQSIDVDIPTLFIWGNEDTAVGRLATETQAQYMKGSYEVIELDANHWLMEESPKQVTDAVLAHLSRHPAGPAM
jgi:pimeloyl-ACP methyl ester carboxylesterase